MAHISEDDTHSPAVAVHALLKECGRLRDHGRYEEAIALCEQVVDRFGRVDDGEIRERVAFTLLRKGLCLEQLGRSEEEMSVYDDLIARYGNCVDPRVRRHVAWGFNNRAIRLRALGQSERAIMAFDELIAHFGDAGEPEVRTRVSWGLWNKAGLLRKLGRSAEASTTYDQLVHRRDEGRDAMLDRNIAWSIEHRAVELRQSGDIEKQIDLSAELVARFGDASDRCLRKHVLTALTLRAAGLAALGRREHELAAYAEITARFTDEADVDIRDAVAESLRRKAVTLADLGRGGDALAAYDDALGLLADVSQPRLCARATEVLLSKGITLGNLDRATEAIVMYDSAVSAYRAGRAPDGGATQALWIVVLALMYKVDLLCALQRAEEAGDTRDQLLSVLDEVTEPTAGEAKPESSAVPEAELAAMFVKVFDGGECWQWFAASHDEVPADLMAERALELYGLTEQWLAQDVDAWSDVAQVAAIMLRDIGDGYAMLARSLSAREREVLPLPERAEDLRARVIRRFGIDDWAAELGYPLALAEGLQTTPGDARADEEPLVHDNSEPVRFSAEFLSGFVAATYHYDLLAVLVDSPGGREILRSEKNLMLHAIQKVSQARNQLRWLWPDLERAAGTAFARLFIAQGFFCASFGKVSSSADLFPSRRILRDLMRDDDAFKVLLDQEVALPQWLNEDDD